MSEHISSSKDRFQWLTTVIGVALFAYLVRRVDPHPLWTQLKSVSNAIIWIIVLGGLTHVVKTCAWRRTFTCDTSRLSWSRSFAVRLASEAIGQLGIAGKFIGEGARISLVKSSVPVTNAISAAALDNALFTMTSAFVSMMAIAVALQLAPLPGNIRVYASLIAGTFGVVLIVVAVGVARGWRALSATFRALKKIGLEVWVDRNLGKIEAIERDLLGFHREAQRAFTLCLLLNLLAHALAVLEVYIVLHSLSPDATAWKAFVLEGLTKVINLIGVLNPGNIGSYEGGNVIIAKCFGLSATVGLTIAICRRTRALFWAAIGAVCLALMGKREKEDTTQMKIRNQTIGQPESNNSSATQLQISSAPTTVIILADFECSSASFLPALESVATLPILLRNILTVEADHPDRIIVCASADAIAAYKSVLNRTRRLPKSVEWREVSDRNLVRLIGGAAVTSNVVLLLGDRCYHPKLLRRAMAWRDSRCLAFGSGDDLVGICVLPQEKAAEIGNSALNITSLKRLHDWLQRLLWVETASVPNDYFQRISVPLDTCEAERKLEGWLIKPTDGIFARANRRISIPISRKLIKLPISANMVSLFVLSISLLCGYCYARGGYWSALVAALLGAAASVLDGCDGEVARFKLQSTAFGCWLDTICDYIWYAVAFAGMGIGLARTSGSHTYYNWGAALLFGTGMTFIVVSIMRRRITNAHPENMLAIWQEKAESRSSNPLLYLGRNTEFILRRCFLPYLLLFFAVFGLTNVIFVLAALGANIAWLIALYSHLDFSQPSTPERAEIGGRMAKPRSA